MSSDQTPTGCFRHLLRRGPVKRRKSKQEKLDINFVDFNACCAYSTSEETLPPYNSPDGFTRTPFSDTIDCSLATFDSQLRQLSLQIHAHPELKFEEKFAHDILTEFMSSRGFRVTKHYLGLDTAWRAEFTHKKGGRVIGINAEMDALAFGHGCGHNLIAASGCGVALAIKAALEAHDLPGKIVLLGTPAEEGGGGKVILLERGAYKEMDLCIMCHPAPGPANSAMIVTTLAMQSIKVEYFGQTAHAGASPWEGTNALDAAFLAYSSISVLRQQIKPDHRVHGVIEGNNNWAPNVIPDYACMRWYIRAPTHSELATFCSRVKNCFEAGAVATSCKVKVTEEVAYYDLLQNRTLAEEFSAVAKHHGLSVSSGSMTASTDFGNVCYQLPALHPGFAIPTQPNGGNHTPAFAKSAAAPEAHEAMMKVSATLAETGLRALYDDAFFKKVKHDHESSIR